MVESYEITKAVVIFSFATPIFCFWSTGISQYKTVGKG